MMDAIVIAGPTAVGKSEMALDLCERLGGEIVSADSMQIYCGFDIGTAKPTAEERARIPHHMIDVADPVYDYTVADYRKAAEQAIYDIRTRGHLPVVVGGTGLYINALIYDMDFAKAPADPAFREKYEQLALDFGNSYVYDILAAKDAAAAARVHPNNLKRVIRALERIEIGSEGQGGVRQFEQSFKLGGLLENPDIMVLTCERDDLIARIDARVDRMMKIGLLSEVESLIASGLTLENHAMLGIGYRELYEHIRGDYSLTEAVDRIKIHTHQYAKRQMTWFRRYETARFIKNDNKKRDPNTQ